MEVFPLFDVDDKGFITLTDLKRVTKELNENLSERELMDMIQEADVESNGRISKENFLILMKKAISL